MKKQIQISLPESYGDIDLKKYLDIQKELINYQDDEDAQIAVLITYLCGLDVKYISGLNKKDFDLLKQSLQKFLEKTDFPLQRFIQIDGIEYGFEPNLSNISYGAYVDITKYDTIAIDTNWAKIMSILYRPVEKKSFDSYSIKAYDGKIDDSKWLNVTMDVHFGTLFFFVRMLTDLLNSTLNSMMHKAELPDNIKSILEKSGKDTHPSTNLPEEI
jgi:hypothetical protein